MSSHVLDLTALRGCQGRPTTIDREEKEDLQIEPVFAPCQLRDRSISSINAQLDVAKETDQGN